MESTLRLIVVGAASCTLAASVGVTSIWLAGLLPEGVFARSWWTWWLGDAVGITLVTPLILAWWGPAPRITRWGRLTEAALLWGAFLGVAALTSRAVLQAEYLFIPCLLAAAFRFGARGATTAAALVCGWVLFATVEGMGSFVHGTRQQGLLAAQAFTALMTAMGLVLTAALTERDERTADLLDTQQALERAIDATERASRVKSVFLGRMSHELRTPLHQILGYCDLLREDESVAQAPGTLADLERIQSAGQRLSQMLADLLDLSHLDTGAIRFDVRSFELADVVREAGASVEPIARRARNSLVLPELDALGSMRGDPERVGRALRHLLSNACGHTEGGTVTLSVRRELRNGSEWVTFSVADTGAGMTREQVERIVEPFGAAAETAVTRPGEGAGLGLPITVRWCRAMGGELSITSQPGHGCTARMTLPAGGPPDRSSTSAWAGPGEV